jgi:branched-chain amino acid transport system substrate-binding protein
VISFAEGAAIMQSMIEQGAGPADIPIYVTDGFKDTVSADAVDPENPAVLEGVKGTAPSAAPENGEPTFPDRFADFAPDAPTIFSAQSYDCLVTLVLAAEAAGSADGIADEMVEVTRGGETCTTYEECHALLAEGADIDYDGASGPLDFTDVGEPGVGTYDVFVYDAEGNPAVQEQVVAGQ